MEKNRTSHSVGNGSMEGGSGSQSEQGGQGRPRWDSGYWVKTWVRGEWATQNTGGRALRQTLEGASTLCSSRAPHEKDILCRSHVHSPSPLFQSGEGIPSKGRYFSPLRHCSSLPSAWKAALDWTPQCWKFTNSAPPCSTISGPLWPPHLSCWFTRLSPPSTRPDFSLSLSIMVSLVHRKYWARVDSW